VLSPYTHREIELPVDSPFPTFPRNASFTGIISSFDEAYFKAFLKEARRIGKACRAAFSAEDPAFREHAHPLSDSYSQVGDLYFADLWYYPHGYEPPLTPVLIDLQSSEVGILPRAHLHGV